MAGRSAQFGFARRGEARGTVKSGARVKWSVPGRTRSGARVISRTWSRGRARDRTYANRRTGGFLGIELKFLDCAFNNALAAPTDATGGELQPVSGCTNALSVPVQGVGEQERDGRAFTVKSMYINGIIDYTAAVDQADSIEANGIFLALVMDSQTNGAAINSEDVFINPGTTANTAVTPLRNLENSQRFKVCDSVYLEPPQVNTMADHATNSSTRSACVVSQISWGRSMFKLSWSGNVKVNTKGTTADVASVTDNSFHLVGFTISTAFTPKLFGLSRCRFVG